MFLIIQLTLRMYNIIIIHGFKFSIFYKLYYIILTQEVDMKFKVNQRELSKAISVVQKAVATKNTMEILKGIYFEIEEGNLLLTTNNMEVGIQTSIPCEVYEEGKIVIDAKIISDIVRKLPNDTIHFTSIDENDLIEVRCQNSKFNIKYIRCEDFPMPAYIDDRFFVKIEADDFKNMILKTNYAIASNDPNQIYMCHFFKIDQNRFTMFSVDNFRFVVMEKAFEDISFDEKKLIINGSILTDIAKTIEDGVEFVKFAFDDKHICVIIDETIITSNLVTGNFIDYESIIPKNEKSTVTVRSSDLKSAIDRVSLLSNNKLIKLESKDFMMNITSRNDQVGNANEIVDIKLEGENFEIAFNCEFLLDILKNIDDEYITMKITNSLSPCKITSESDENYIHVILPVRIKK